MNGHTTTVHEFTRAHWALGLDVFFSVPYALYLEQIVLFATLLYFVDRSATSRFTWAFFALNLMGFLTHHVYPAAPPWYHAIHGCTVDVAAHGSAGPNLARVDAWLGVPYFAGFYARSKDVFGAVPSLHCAYPLLVVLETFLPRNGDRTSGLVARPRLLFALRITSVGFLLWMCGAAVYLDHHWVVDVVLGLAYGAAVFAGIRYVERVARGRFSAENRISMVTPAADSSLESK
jgi:hypothetical protein